MVTGGLATLLLLSEVAISTPTPTPLDQAEEGFVQCYQPDDEGKTCQSIASYTRNPDGSWTNTATILLSPTSPVTLETVSTVVIRGGAVCGVLSSQDFLRGRLRFAGQPVPEDIAAESLAELADGLAFMMNREICTTYVPGTDGLIARATIEGEAMQMPQQNVRWILPSDAYQVAPAGSAAS